MDAQLREFKSEFERIFFVGHTKLMQVKWAHLQETRAFVDTYALLVTSTLGMPLGQMVFEEPVGGNARINDNNRDTFVSIYAVFVRCYKNVCRTFHQPMAINATLSTHGRFVFV